MIVVFWKELAFGYGDDDDGTIIDKYLYCRKFFDINDISIKAIKD